LIFDQIAEDKKAGNEGRRDGGTKGRMGEGVKGGENTEQAVELL